MSWTCGCTAANMVHWLGGALGPVLGGVFFDMYGARTAFALLAGIIFVAAVFSVGLRVTEC